MNNTYNLLKSRTFWLLFFASILPVLNAITPTLPVGIQDIVSALLSLAAIYTHNSMAQRAGATN